MRGMVVQVTILEIDGARFCRALSAFVRDFFSMHWESFRVLSGAWHRVIGIEGSL